MKESDAEKKYREDGEIVLGEVEVHEKFTRYQEDFRHMTELNPPAGTT